MLDGIIRVTEVAQLLGVDPRTVRIWAARLGIETMRAPAELPDRTGKKLGPHYYTLQQSITIMDGICRLQYKDREKRKARLVRMAQRRAESTANIRHNTDQGVPRKSNGLNSGDTPPSATFDPPTP